MHKIDFLHFGPVSVYSQDGKGNIRTKVNQQNNFLHASHGSQICPCDTHESKCVSKKNKRIEYYRTAFCAFWFFRSTLAFFWEYTSSGYPRCLKSCATHLPFACDYVRFDICHSVWEGRQCLVVTGASLAPRTLSSLSWSTLARHGASRRLASHHVVFDTTIRHSAFWFYFSRHLKMTKCGVPLFFHAIRDLWIEWRGTHANFSHSRARDRTNATVIRTFLSKPKGTSQQKSCFNFCLLRFNRIFIKSKQTVVSSSCRVTVTVARFQKFTASADRFKNSTT